MPSEKESHSKKKPKSDDSKPVQKTSDDILASLFNDLESTGQVDDLVQLINGSDKIKARRPEKRKFKSEPGADDSPSKSKRSKSKERKSEKRKVRDEQHGKDDGVSKSRRSRSKERKSDKLKEDGELGKSKRDKTKDRESDKPKVDDKNGEISKSRDRKSDKLKEDGKNDEAIKSKSSKSKDRKADKTKEDGELVDGKPKRSKDKKAKKKKAKSEKHKKDKSKKSKSSVNGEEKAHKKKSKRSKSRSPSKRDSSPPTRRRAERSRSPVKRKRSASPVRKTRQRSMTPPMYRTKWDSYRSKFDWGKGHSRDNTGLLPWERDRWSRERSRSWSPTRFQHRRRSTSPKPRELDERRIDRKELLALARKNATRLAMEGRLPKGIELGSTLKNKSVRELIELCEEIQTREMELAEPVNMVVDKDQDYEETNFKTAAVRSSIKIRLKDGSSVEPKTSLERMIEENSLRKHFPVSYGDSHKGHTDKMTKDWVPVEIETPAPAPDDSVMVALTKKTVKVQTAYTAYKLPDEVKVVKKEEPPPPMAFVPPMIDMIPSFPLPPFPMPQLGGDFYGGYEAPEIISAAFLTPPPPPSFSSFDNPVTSAEISVPEPAPLMVVSNADLIAQAEEFERENVTQETLDSVTKEEEPVIAPQEESGVIEQVPETSNQPTDVPMEIERSPHDEGVASPTPPPAEYVLPEGAVLDKPVAPISIGGLVSRRARLVMEINQDPNDYQKQMEIADIDLKLSLWAKVKNETTARFGAAANMSQSVEPRPVNNSIWATKDTLRNAPEFKGGIGEHLLKKMGWSYGQGLGRNMDGPVEPLTLDVKADRKGLYSTKDKLPPRREHAAILNGNKNPVSAIMEYSAKKGVPPPLFLPTEEGSSNNRRFGCKAVFNGVEYDAATGATNKKAAKAQVCLIMCQAMGIQ